MKNISLFLTISLIATPAFTITEDASLDPVYVLIKHDGKEKPQSLDGIINGGELFWCITDINRFKAAEKTLAFHNLNIFRVRVLGFSLLQHALLFCSDSDSEVVVDYILSKLTKDELNEFVEGSYQLAPPSIFEHTPLLYYTTEYVYYGTAVAVAALHSPHFLTKILEDKRFDSSTFLTSRWITVRGEKIESLTPSYCHFIFRCLNNDAPSYTKKDADDIMKILEENFNLS